VEPALLVHHACVASSAATRGDVQRWLDRVPVESLGLGEGELFYVPRLRMRLPDHGGITATHMPDRILAALRQLLASAESGWDRGFLPDRPYRFTSHARHFAWLIRLWIDDGSAPAREAFNRSTGRASLVEWQRATLLRDGPALVATIARLVEIGIAARWLARFEAADITLARRAIEASFGFTLVTPGETEEILRPIAAPEVRRRPSSPAATLLQETVTRLVSHGVDWSGLPITMRVLLLASAILARKPAIAAGRPTDIATLIANVAASPAEPVQIVRTDPAEPSPTGNVPSARARAAEALNHGPPAPARIRRPTRAASPGRASQPALSPDEACHDAARHDAAKQQQFDGMPTASASPISMRERRPPTILLAPDAHFTTDFGGLLFLLNAFVALDLYPDFTQPKGRRLQPSPLWLVDRVGRCRFGAAYRRDPLSNWIVAHAERGRLPRSWHVSEPWLNGFGSDIPLRLTRNHGRATLWHPAGFPVFDGTERDLLKGRRRARLVSNDPAHLPRTGRWPACLALYLEARLQKLTGAGLALLAQPASVDIRDLDIRATFRLDRHPVELRLAGLDRNPGWQPAEGRSIAFTFE